MPARIPPAQAPFSPGIQQRMDEIMRGAPPLTLFTTLARDERLFHKFFNAGLLDKGNLTLREREIVIDRITALSGSEYEWGVHIAIYAAKAGFSEAQIDSLATGGSQDACWSAPEKTLLQACEALHADCRIDDTLWQELRSIHGEAAILEILMLAGFYRTVSYLTNALEIPREAFGARFPGQN